MLAIQDCSERFIFSGPGLRLCRSLDDNSYQLHRFIASLRRLHELDMIELRVSQDTRCNQLIISKINEGMIHQILQLFIQDRPAQVPLNVWLVLDRNIKIYWRSFNAELQHHIIDCYQLIARQRASSMVYAQLLTPYEITSPISFDPPAIPG